MAPKRIQLSRAKGWRLPENAMKVDRTTAFGNPYRIGEPMDMKQARRWGWNISPEGRNVVCRDDAEAVARFCHCLHWDEAIHGHVREKLAGKDLACWCDLDRTCHADILLTIANSDPEAILKMHNAIDAAIMVESEAALRQRVETESDMSASELTGNPAGCLMIVCPQCNCESFRLLAPAPEGGKIGDRLPVGKHRITAAECIACGEQCYPFADYR